MLSRSLDSPWQNVAGKPLDFQIATFEYLWPGLALLFAVAGSAPAAEHVFDFSRVPLGEQPPGFRSTVGGQGGLGEWKVILADAPTAFAPITAKAKPPQERVLAQLSRDITDEHFPMLVYEEQEFGDFTLTTRIKNVQGAMEQMAGIAFRLQDENNYYYVRLSSLGNTFRFFKVVDGVRGPAIGPEIDIPKDEWHKLTIECKGNQIRCLLNDQEAIPEMTDHSFLSGKIAFWAKSDSVSYFTDTRITFKPKRSLAQTLVDRAIERYPRLVGLKIFAIPENAGEVRIVASKNGVDVGEPGGKVEADVIESGSIYFGRNKDRTVTVTLPLDDHNGDPIAAVRVVLESFPGQTEKNAIVRATPIVKLMQERTRTGLDLLD